MQRGRRHIARRKAAVIPGNRFRGGLHMAGTISRSQSLSPPTPSLVETTLAEPAQSTLSGVARMLVHAGKLQAKAAEDLVKQAREKKTSFVNTVIASGQV